MEEEKLELSDKLKSGLDKVVYWSKFFGILGFIGGALLVVFAIVMVFSPVPGFESFPMIFIGLFYILLAVLYYFPSKYMYDFSIKTRNALNTINQYDLEDGFRDLASCYKFFGVFTIVTLSVYVLVILGGLLRLV